MAKQKLCTSPFFHRKRRRTVDSRISSSSFFCRSSSSALGAALSLGPLSVCLSPSRTANDDSEHCINNEASITSIKATALRHFSFCPQFLSEWNRRSYLFNNARLEEIETELRKCVSHLCPYRCYMRLHAPCRNWLALRSALVNFRSERELDQILKGWKCSLLLPTCSSEDGLNFKPKTVFLDTEKRHFETIKSVLDQICTAGCSHKILARDVPPLQSSSALKAPFSTPFGFLEELFCDSPWKLLLSTIFLNRTCRVQVDAVLYEFLCTWPCASAVVKESSPDKISEMIRPLGMRHRRAAGIIRFSREFLKLSKHPQQYVRKETDECLVINRTGFDFTEKEILSLSYCGTYAYAAYQLFIQRNYSIEPRDHALKAYAAYHRGKITDDSTKLKFKM